jgi:uncharacterized membrane protein YphA (DoxX/SURF4 family)
VRTVTDRRRQLGGFAILALVLLRLSTGWHFFSEGLEKIERDSTTGRYRVTFSAAGFLSQAKGPLADVFHGLMPDGHGWQELLAVPHQNRPLTAEETKVAATHKPYQDWTDRIVADWQAILDKAAAVPVLTEDQIQQAKATFELRQQELKDYLAGESSAIAEYQHELWRLGEWRAKPEATSVPFQEERIAKKAAETSAAAKPWVAQVELLDQSYVADLREILKPEPQANKTTASAIDRALTSPEQARLNWVNLAATCLTIGVGTCLLLGLFTRLSALAGAVFLLSIIATQPPWLATAEPTIYQTVEIAGLLVLAGTGAGRWLGLDYFSWALFCKHDD